jgi:hypothetical protein
MEFQTCHSVRGFFKARRCLGFRRSDASKKSQTHDHLPNCVAHSFVIYSLLSYINVRYRKHTVYAFVGLVVDMIPQILVVTRTTHHPLFSLMP